MAYDFPPDLIEIHRRFLAPGTAAAASREEWPAAFTAQQEAALARHRHPFWDTVKGERYKADMALREAARTATTPTE